MSFSEMLGANWRLIWFAAVRFLLLRTIWALLPRVYEQTLSSLSRQQDNSQQGQCFLQFENMVMLFNRLSFSSRVASSAE